MVSPLLILGGLVAGGVATVMAIRKKKAQEVPPGIVMVATIK